MVCRNYDRIEANVIIQNEFLEPGDSELFFPGEEVTLIEDNLDMYDILTRFGLFKSKGDARNNWKQTNRDIPPGFSDYKYIGKLHSRLTVLRPVPRTI
jgi:hypothetical protein